MKDICPKCGNDKNYTHERDGSQMCWCAEDICQRPDDVTGEPCQNPAEEPGKFCCYCRQFEQMREEHDDYLAKTGIG